MTFIDGRDHTWHWVAMCNACGGNRPHGIEVGAHHTYHVCDQCGKRSLVPRDLDLDDRYGD